MKIKIKHIAFVLFLVDAILIIINMEYRDPTASVIADLTRAKIFFYLGTLSFIIYIALRFIVFFKQIKSKELLKLAPVIIITSLSISMFFNLRLAKDNYARIQCNKGISEYYKYFEYESCEKMKKRFEEDLINGELIYFQDAYNPNLEFEERLRDKHAIELIGISCTQFTSMECYNDLVKEYIKKKERKDN